MALVTPGMEFPAPQRPARVHRPDRHLRRPAAPPSLAALPQGREALLATIRAWEGEAMAQPPLMFRVVVALGIAMIAGAGLLLVGLAA